EFPRLRLPAGQGLLRHQLAGLLHRGDAVQRRAVLRFRHRLEADTEGAGVASPVATSAARISARPLCRVSSYSACGSESATMPAAACTCSVPSFTTPVRMAMARSMSPLNPR